MTSEKARKTTIRARMAATGEPYSVAARALTDRAPAATATIDRELLVPYPDEHGVTPEELGWRVLPADATPAQRARAEAVWRPVNADRPCRCTGPCYHGQGCNNGEDGIGSCTGRLNHFDRYPGSLLDVTAWYDEYACDTCDESFETTVTLVSVPWGEHHDTEHAGQRVTNGGTTVYPGVRHPNFRESSDDEDDGYYGDDGGCPDCNGGIDDRCVCDRDDGCPECGAGGRGDPYGECTCYPE